MAQADAIFALWSSAHGMAHLLIEENLHPIFGASGSRELLTGRLPGVIAAI